MAITWYKVLNACLLQGFIVDKAGGILGEVELSTLNLLSELPAPTP